MVLVQIHRCEEFDVTLLTAAASGIGWRTRGRLVETNAAEPTGQENIIFNCFNTVQGVVDENEDVKKKVVETDGWSGVYSQVFSQIQFHPPLLVFIVSWLTIHVSVTFRVPLKCVIVMVTLGSCTSSVMKTKRFFWDASVYHPIGRMLECTEQGRSYLASLLCFMTQF